MNIQSKILLILDLDETLIYASREELEYKANFLYSDYHVYVRPRLLEFLELVDQSFSIAIWSSAHDKYVSEIVERIFPKEMSLEFVGVEVDVQLREI